MQKKMKCKSCGSEKRFGEQNVVFCPQCGSRDLEFEPLPEKILEGAPQVRPSEPLKSDSIESSELFKEIPDPMGLSPSYQLPQIERRSQSGTRTRKSNVWQIRLVIGVIGLIMLLQAAGMLYSGLTRNFSGGFGGLAGPITLGVIGVILLAIATKGECCNC